MKEIEDIILEKEYFELSVEEKAAMSDLVSNEEEFAEMKWFLNRSKKTIKGSEIEPSSNLKAGVFAELSNPANKRIWLSGSGAAIGPKRKIYQMPAFQIGIAACVIVGFLFLANPFGADKNLALNETTPDEVSNPDQVIEEPTTVEDINQEGVAELPKEEVAEEVGIDDVELNNLEEDAFAKDLKDGDKAFTNRQDVATGSGSDGSGSGGSVSSANQVPAADDYDMRSEDFALANDLTITTDELNDQISTNKRDKKDKDGVSTQADEIVMEAEEIDDNSYKENLKGENAPGNPVTTTGGAVSTITTEGKVDADMAEKSTFARAGNLMSKTKSEEVAKSADVPSLNAVSIAETKELKSLFFTVP